MTPKVFLQFTLPNATTWTLFSLLLAVALFFKFSRLLSMRNLDVLTLFLLVPGLLFLQEAHQVQSQASQVRELGKRQRQLANDSVNMQVSQMKQAGEVQAELRRQLSALDLTDSADQQRASERMHAAYLALEDGESPTYVKDPLARAADSTEELGRQLGEVGSRWLWIGYLWLLCGSGYFLLRCLIDLTLVRRPALAPNLNFGGLAWLGGALAVFMIFVAVKQTEAPDVGKVTTAVTEVERLVGQQLRHSAAVMKVGSEVPVRATLALFCHLAVITALVVIGCRHFQDAHIGMAAAALYLLLPYTAIHISQYHHVWPSALLVWAVACYRKPMLAGLLIGLAAGFAFFPLLVLPVWLSFYRGGRGAGRFLLTLLLIAFISFGIHVWWEGGLLSSLRAAFSDPAWQGWEKASTEGFWHRADGTSVHWAYRLPVFIAYLAFLVTTTFWPTPKNLAQTIALTAALVIGVQFWYADQGGVYVLWYLPLLLLLMFRPNLADRRPPLIEPDNDRLSRAGRWLRTQFVRLLRMPEPAVRVH
jgi:hypothetical protein